MERSFLITLYTPKSYDQAISTNNFITLNRMTMQEFMIDYFEGLHLRKQKPDFTVENELDYIEEKFCDNHQYDCMLCFDATLNMELDVLSSKKEVEEYKKKARIIYRRIKNHDEEASKVFLRTQDK
jgi:hypothetical protein